MKASVPLLCLLVAAASAHQATPAQSKPQMVRRSNKLLPRMPLLFGSSTDGTSGSSDGSDGTDGSESTDGSDSGQTSVDSAATLSASSSVVYSSSTSASQAPSTSSSSSQAAFTPTSSSSSQRPTSTSISYQSTATVTSSSKVLSSTTDASGSTVVITQTLAAVTSSSTAPATSATESAASDASSSSSSSGHTGLIVGVSVVGGVALLGALIFLWMKFGGKRFSDYQDEDADIKWPELKTDGDSAAMQPLPARRTGGAGFDMGNEFDDQRDIDGQSMAEYGETGRESMMGSTTALNAGIGAGAGSNYAAHGGGAAYGEVMEGGAYHDDSPSATNHYAQPAVAGYYDPYGNDTYSNNNQTQSYYPEAGHDQEQQRYLQNPHYDQQQQQQLQYDDYNNYQSDPYAAARAQAASTSPHMQPYRVNTQNMHQDY